MVLPATGFYSPSLMASLFYMTMLSFSKSSTVSIRFLSTRRLRFAWSGEIIGFPFGPALLPAEPCCIRLPWRVTLRYLPRGAGEARTSSPRGSIPTCVTLG